MLGSTGVSYRTMERGHQAQEHLPPILPNSTSPTELHGAALKSSSGRKKNLKPLVFLRF